MPSPSKNKGYTFLKNKYSKWYFLIIEQSKVRTEMDGYTEKHHIVPRSLGGNNNRENIVILSLKAHFICHLLLTKMTEKVDRQKMVYAAWRLSTNKNIKNNSRTYGIIKKDFIKLNSRSNLEKFGEEKSKEISKKISDTSKGRFFSTEVKEKMSNAHKGRLSWNKGLTKETNDSLKSISESQKGKKRTLESRQKQSKTITGNKRKPHTSESKLKSSISNKNRPRFLCEHCLAFIQIGNYKRWHGENCRYNNDK